MRESRFIAIFGLGALLVLAARPAGAAENCARFAQSNPPLRALVDRINARGFEEARYTTVGRPWDVTFSPLAEWYTDFIVRLGSDKPPVDAEQRGIRSLTNCLREVTKINVASGIWLNPSDSTYDSARVRAGANNANASLVERAGPTTDAQFDKEMTDWIGRNFRGFPKADNFVRVVDSGGRNIRAGSNPFRTLTLVALQSRLDAPPTDREVLTWYYSSGSVQGVRFDGKTAAVSAYVFVGDNASIADLCKSLDARTWRAITGRFSQESVFAQPIRLDVKTGLLGFRPSTQFPYDTALSGVAGWSALTLDPGALTLSTLTGTTGLRHEHIVEGPLVSPRGFSGPFLSTRRAMLYVVEDRTTGVLLFIGSHLNQNVPAN